jgi:hypothetical protein
VPRSKIYIDGRKYCYDGPNRNCYRAALDAPSDDAPSLETATVQINEILAETGASLGPNEELAILVVPAEDRLGEEDGLQLGIIYTDLDIHP